MRTPARLVIRQTLRGLLLLLGVALVPFAAGAQATPVREADASCAKCHAEIYQKYLATPMADASGLATEKLFATSFVHKPSGAEYKIAVVDGKATLAFRAPGSEGWTDRRLSYFFGSGHLGTTYLYSIDDYLFESPVAWYAASQGYDMKPGLENMRQMPPPLPMQSSCMRCHMSGVQASDRGTINRYKGLPFLHGGITCEECHGDGQKHVSSAGRGAIVNPARLDADKRDSVCIVCHLEGDVAVERAGRSALNYRPGDSVSEYMAYYVKTGANITARGVSEVEQLRQSTCKRMSGDKMSCTSCHDPHYRPDAEHRAAFFRGKCLTCHNQPEFAKTHHPENQDCTRCHMQRTGAVNIPHVAWTDHRILRVPEDQKTAPQGQAPAPQDKVELVPIFSPGATDRDRAMAYYKALLEGDREFEVPAWEQLRAQRESIDGDQAALDALGNLSSERGEFKDAEQLFRRVLGLDPSDLTALSNLGMLLAKQGDLKGAIVMMQKAFDQNEDLAGLAMNLAKVECAAGDGPAAQRTLKAALRYSPDLESMKTLLARVATCGEGANK